MTPVQGHTASLEHRQTSPDTLLILPKDEVDTLIDRYFELHPIYDDDEHLDATEKLANIIITDAPGASKVVDAMIDWLGSDAKCDQASTSASVVLQRALRESSAAQQAAISEKLRLAESDDKHPYRSGDVVRLLSFALKDEKFVDGRLSAAIAVRDDHTAHSALTQVALRLGNLWKEGNIEAVKESLKQFVDSFCKIAENFSGNPYYGMSLTYASALLMMQEWAKRAPDLLLDELTHLPADVEVEDAENSGSDFSLRVAVISKLLADCLKNLPQRLLRRVPPGQEEPNIIVLNALFNLGPSAVNPLLDSMMEVPDRARLRMLSRLLPYFGKEGLDAVVTYINPEKPEHLMYGMAWLAVFALEVARGASDEQEIVSLSSMERVLRGERVQAIVKRARNSEDSQVIEQVRIFEAMLSAV